jgi:hypothetical protein
MENNSFLASFFSYPCHGLPKLPEWIAQALKRRATSHVVYELKIPANKPYSGGLSCSVSRVQMEKTFSNPFHDRGQLLSARMA